MQLEKHVVIATHHKTGTVWMRRVFKGIADHLNIPFINLKRNKIFEPRNIAKKAIFLNDHSEFANCNWILEDEEYRILHVIRDPRDVLVSAMRYHLSASESWLHKPKKKFGHRSYQEKLNSLANDHLRYEFEMNNSTKNIITDMRNWNYALPTSIECKYEDLITDKTMALFAGVVHKLGFSEIEIEVCKRFFWENSLFGGVDAEKSQHIHSGAERQWVQAFDKVLANDFIERFGDILIHLQYETDNSWVSVLK